MKIILILLFIVSGKAAAQDSSKIYYKKYIYWQRKMNDELEKINRFQTPNITKALFRFQDSTLKYQTLLNKLKTPKQ